MSDYSPEEIKKLIAAPVNVGVAACIADFGVISTAIEAIAMTKQFENVANKYPNNSIIQAAFSKEVLKDAKIESVDMSGEDVQPGIFVERTLAAVTEAIQLVEGRASAEEITQFKQFIYDCGSAVAQAAGSGFAGTGAKVSEKEAALLNRVKTTLGLS
jgi:hypothetical protein